MIAEALEVLEPLEEWAFRCHAASLLLVRSGVLGPSRVARGTCEGVGGQHSWVVLGDDCYDEGATIVDPTMWSYVEDVEGIWTGVAREAPHWPFGKGRIWDWGRPNKATGPVVELTPRRPWSGAAEAFLTLLGPLDREGWRMLAHAPVQGWPAAEIIDAICESGMEGYVPIDIRGMITDRNPKGLYLPECVTE